MCFKIIPSKKKKRLCTANRCRNQHTEKDRFCSKHRKRLHKHNNLAAYTYNLLKSNANRRGKTFNLTLEEFKTWCDGNNYLIEKGKKAGSASIDRDDPLKGYEIGNMEKMSLSENSAKMHRDNADDYPF
jgi:hypothetical protein